MFYFYNPTNTDQNLTFKVCSSSSCFQVAANGCMSLSLTVLKNSVKSYLLSFYKSPFGLEINDCGLLVFFLN
jgi:hypothetical protein